MDHLHGALIFGTLVHAIREVPVSSSSPEHKPFSAEAIYTTFTSTRVAQHHGHYSKEVCSHNAHPTHPLQQDSQSTAGHG